MNDQGLLQTLSYLNLAIGAAVTVLIALLLLQKQRSPLKFLVASFYLIMLYGLITGWLARSGLIDRVPYLLFTTYIISYAHGPVLYLYTDRLLSRTARFRPRQLLLFVPSLLMLGAVAIFHAAFPEQARAALANRSPFPRIELPLMYALSSLGDFTVSVYLFLCGAKVIQAARARDGEKAQGLFVFFWMYVAAAVTYLGVLAGHMLNHQPTVLVFSTLNGLSALVYFLYVHQSPDITQRTLKDPGAATQHAASAASMGELMAKLERLMTQGKAYLDPDLSLPAVSAKLGVNANTISLILNESMGVNFRRWINSYRLAEAKRLLANDAESSVLDIAFEVGFNSKSTFNRRFSHRILWYTSFSNYHLQGGLKGIGKARAGAQIAPGGFQQSHQIA